MFGRPVGARASSNDYVVDVSASITAACVNDEDVIHHILKGGGSVVETEGHNTPLETTHGGVEGGFPFVSVLDADVVVTGSNVQLGKFGTSFPLVQKFGDEWERIRILYRDVVELSVVDDHPFLSIFLVDEEAGGSEGRFGRLNSS